VAKTEVVALEVPDIPGGLAGILSTLDKAGSMWSTCTLSSSGRGERDHHFPFRRTGQGDPGTSGCGSPGASGGGSLRPLTPAGSVDSFTRLTE